MRTRRPLSFTLSALGLSATALVACADDAPLAPNTGKAASPIARTDERIRTDLARALSVGALCNPSDGACVKAVLGKVEAELGRADASADARVAKVVAFSRALGHEEICRHLSLTKEQSAAYYTLGAPLSAMSVDSNAEIVFDLTHRTAAVFTYGASGIGAVIPARGSVYESLATAREGRRDLIEAWTGAFAAAPSSLTVRGGTTGFIGEGGNVAGVAGEAPWPTVLGAMVRGVVAVDASRFDTRVLASDGSTRVVSTLLAPLGPETKGGPGARFLQFEDRAGALGLHPGLATAVAITQLSGLEGMAPRAAAIAIATWHVERDLDGDVEAYCGAASQVAGAGGKIAPKSVLGVRTFDTSVAPLGDEANVGCGGGSDLDGGLQGIMDRIWEEALPQEDADCASDPEQACDKVYPGEGLACAWSGERSCCQLPVKFTKGCLQDIDCADGEICTAAEGKDIEGTVLGCAKPAECSVFTSGGASKDQPVGPIACRPIDHGGDGEHHNQGCTSSAGVTCKNRDMGQACRTRDAADMKAACESMCKTLGEKSNGFHECGQMYVGSGDGGWSSLISGECACTNTDHAYMQIARPCTDK